MKKFQVNKLFVLFIVVATLIATILVEFHFNEVKSASSNYRQHSEEMKYGRKPLILFIVADDLRYNDIGYHGSVIKIPYIDWLAKAGVILENYYVQPVCTPTRGQFLSGRYQVCCHFH